VCPKKSGSAGGRRELVCDGNARSGRPVKLAWCVLKSSAWRRARLLAAVTAATCRRPRLRGRVREHLHQERLLRLLTSRPRAALEARIPARMAEGTQHEELELGSIEPRGPVRRRVRPTPEASIWQRTALRQHGSHENKQANKQTKHCPKTKNNFMHATRTNKHCMR
jgi:hypothetical protein